MSSGREVEETSPMKRGLKQRHRGVVHGEAVVEETSPMKRGLKLTAPNSRRAWGWG